MDWLERRQAGLLLHPTSLPGRDGVGDLGQTAHRFVDWLADCGFGLWQILPLSLPGSDQCPYVAAASLATNPLLIDLEALVEAGLLARHELPPPASPATRVDFGAAIAAKHALVERAAVRLGSDAATVDEWLATRQWALDTAEFLAIKEVQGGAPWWTWPEPLARRDAAALERFHAEHAATVRRIAATQWLVDRQWWALRAHAHQRGVRIVGDLPIYVDRDSADVWAGRALFQLNRDGTPKVVAGVPPDYFSALGQLWGNPLYDWARLAETGYAWWIARMRRTLELTDLVRLDHFRAFAAYWEVPADAPDARTGRWVEGPGLPFFSALREALGELPLLAEDLGDVDEPVHALRDTLGLPGMRVLQFGFDGDYHNLHHPRNCPPNSFCYTGTHDNDTIVGWWASLDEATRHRVRVDLSTPGTDIAWEMIDAAMRTASRVCIVPMQDLLGLPSAARMNTPGVVEGNWRWKLADLDLPPELSARVRAVLTASSRLPGSAP